MIFCEGSPRFVSRMFLRDSSFCFAPLRMTMLFNWFTLIVILEESRFRDDEGSLRLVFICLCETLRSDFTKLRRDKQAQGDNQFFCCHPPEQEIMIFCEGSPRFVGRMLLRDSSFHFAPLRMTMLFW